MTFLPRERFRTLPERFFVPIYALGDATPDIDPTAYVHPDAVVIGRVTLGPGASVWPGTVLRGDYGGITVGARTSVQDGTIVHATADHPTVIGAECVVGHAAHLEGCTVEDQCLVGSGSVLLHGVLVRRGALVAAGAVLSNNKSVPSRAIALGVPAKIRENYVPEGAFERTVNWYVENADRYRRELRRLD